MLSDYHATVKEEFNLPQSVDLWPAAGLYS